jgi:hypothetical protein
MAIGQNGLQHRNSFELDYGSRAILAMSIPMHSQRAAANLIYNVVWSDIDLRFSF